MKKMNGDIYYNKPKTITFKVIGYIHAKKFSYLASDGPVYDDIYVLVDHNLTKNELKIKESKTKPGFRNIINTNRLDEPLKSEIIAIENNYNANYKKALNEVRQNLIEIYKNKSEYTMTEFEKEQRDKCQTALMKEILSC